MSQHKEDIYFVDASFSNHANLAVGAYIKTEKIFDMNEAPKFSESLIRTQWFAAQSPAEAELKTVIWLLQEIIESRTWGLISQISIFTDCQMIVQLEERRNKLETKQFLNRFGKELKMAALYQKFFALIDQVTPAFIWTKGHTSRLGRTAIDSMFAFVDQAARAELRKKLSLL